MKKFVLGSLAVLALWLTCGANNATAAWQYRTVSRYDPHCGRFVVTTERYWVPDCAPAYQPIPYRSNYADPYRATWNDNFYRGGNQGYDRYGRNDRCDRDDRYDRYDRNDRYDRGYYNGPRR